MSKLSTGRLMTSMYLLNRYPASRGPVCLPKAASPRPSLHPCTLFILWGKHQ